VVGRGIFLPFDDRLSRRHVEFWITGDTPYVLASRLGMHKVISFFSFLFFSSFSFFFLKKKKKKKKKKSQ